MRTLFSTLLCFSLLLVFGFGCNKDAAGANSGNDTFLAPASAPDLPPRPKADPNEMERKAGPEQKPVSDGSEDIVKLTPEEEAAAKRMGPGRVSPPATRTETAQPVTAGSRPASVPSTGQPTKPVLDYDRAVFAISKTACYGRCPQYSLELTNDRRLILDAKKNMDREGKYSRMLSAVEYSALLRAMEATEPASLGVVYPTDVKMIPADAQATVLRYADVYGKERKVEVYSDAPKQLAKLLADLESWVDKDGWVKMAE